MAEPIMPEFRCHFEKICPVFQDLAAIIAEFGPVEECVRLAQVGKLYELIHNGESPKGESDGS